MRNKHHQNRPNTLNIVQEVNQIETIITQEQPPDKSEPTWQEKASKRIVQLFYLIKREKVGRTVHDALLKTSRYELEQDIATIITQEQLKDAPLKAKH